MLYSFNNPLQLNDKSMGADRLRCGPCRSDRAKMRGVPHLGRDLRNHLWVPASAWTRLLCRAIHSSASASVANLLTVVGWVYGMTTSTPKYPPVRAIEFHTSITSKFYGDDYAVRR